MICIFGEGRLIVGVWDFRNVLYLLYLLVFFIILVYLLIFYNVFCLFYNRDWDWVDGYRKVLG